MVKIVRKVMLRESKSISQGHLASGQGRMSFNSQGHDQGDEIKLIGASFLVSGFVITKSKYQAWGDGSIAKMLALQAGGPAFHTHSHREASPALGKRRQGLPGIPGTHWPVSLS